MDLNAALVASILLNAIFAMYYFVGFVGHRYHNPGNVAAERRVHFEDGAHVLRTGVSGMISSFVNYLCTGILWLLQIIAVVLCLGSLVSGQQKKAGDAPDDVFEGVCEQNHQHQNMTCSGAGSIGSMWCEKRHIFTPHKNSSALEEKPLRCVCRAGFSGHSCDECAVGHSLYPRCVTTTDAFEEMQLLQEVIEATAPTTFAQFDGLSSDIQSRMFNEKMTTVVNKIHDLQESLGLRSSDLSRMLPTELAQTHETLSQQLQYYNYAKIIGSAFGLALTLRLVIEFAAARRTATYLNFSAVFPLWLAVAVDSTLRCVFSQLKVCSTTIFDRLSCSSCTFSTKSSVGGSSSASASTASSASSRHVNSRNEHAPFFNSFYQLGELVGCGGQAEVYAARGVPESDTYHQNFAVKVLKMKGATNEVNKHKRASQHPNIVKYIDAYYEEQKTYLVMELMNGSLSDLPFRLNPLQLVQVSIEILNGLCHLHKQGIFHCDIKPGNILYQWCPAAQVAHVKIGDFGMAKSISEEDGQHSTHHSAHRCGTYFFMAPEVFHHKTYSMEADIYSFGRTFLALSSSVHMCSNCIDTDHFQDEYNPECERVKFNDMQQTFPPVVDAIMLCLRHDRKERPTATALLKTFTEVLAPFAPGHTLNSF